MRPLNITNTDNRIMCSAIRLHIELAIAPGVSMAQRGFIKGRPMLSNIVDIEEAMLSSSLPTAQRPGGAAACTGGGRVPKTLFGLASNLLTATATADICKSVSTPPNESRGMLPFRLNGSTADECLEESVCRNERGCRQQN